MTIIIALLLFSLLIFIHEFGHFIAARIFGVTIKEFAIGMGPKLLSRTSKKSGVTYSIKLLPIGGYVSMAGEDEESLDPNALSRKEPWKRLVIMVAGAAMNLLLGVLVMSVIVISTPKLGSTRIFRFSEDNALTQASGLEIGDEIVKINRVSVHTANDLVYTVMREGAEAADVTVLRGGKKIMITNVTFPTVTEEGHLYGTVDFKVEEEPRTVGTVIKHAYFQSVTSIRMIWQSLFDLITGRYGLEDLSGPVGTTAVITQAAKQGTMDLLYICGLLSLNLGVVNLLPLPALDGGRIVFVLIEMIRRKPMKPEYEGYIHFVGLVLLMILMLVVTYKDFVKLFVK